ncbi:MAG: sensor histidine kinase [Clostridiales bacterium]|nr:sensor histidine kinase [Clostridiales bacterium]
MQHRFFSRLGKSLRGRISLSMVVVMLLMIIPALASITMMTTYATRYHDVITRMDRISSLSPVISDELLGEMWSIVAGRETFAQGKQFQTLNAVSREMDLLIQDDSASRIKMTVARNTMNTLTRYIENLGEQMESGSTVEEDEQTLAEIRNVGSLVVEMLGDAITAEIDASMATSNQLQRVVQATLLMEVSLLLGTLVFATIAQRSLGQAIGGPILQLKHFAGMIAGGHLDVRAPEPEVSELSDLTLSLNTMAGKLAELIQENKREQDNLKKSEMRTLQAQIAPHFLYNTLDAIIWLAESRKASEVINVTRALSNFFRISLSGGQDWITLGQEVEHLQGYLTIQKVRYRDILDYDMQVDESLYGLYILKLVIQPLVENAIYHGIKNRRGGGRLSIVVERQGDRLSVRVHDNGAGMSAQRLEQVRQAFSTGDAPEGETGYGLYSVDKRIRLYYNQPEGLKVTSVQGEGTTIEFNVPILANRGDQDA